MQATNLREGPDLAIPPPSRPGDRRLGQRSSLTVLSAAALAVVLAGTLGTGPGRWLSRDVGPALGLVLVAGTSAVVLLRRATKPGAWSGTRILCAGTGVFTFVQAASLSRRILEPVAGQRPAVVLGAAVLLAASLAALVVDLREHVSEQRSALVSDVAIVAVLTGGTALVLIRESDPRVFTPAGIAFAMIAAASIALAAGRVVLMLWCPTWVHASLLACAGGVSASSLALARSVEVANRATLPATPQVALGLSLAAMAATLVVEPWLTAGGVRRPRTAWWTRPAVLGISISGAGAILLVGLVTPHAHLRAGEVIVLSAAFLGTVGARALVNQVRLGHTTTELERAVGEKDHAIESLRDAVELATASEARLRLLVDSAVDGIVELDAQGVIVRANSAFCSMIRVPLREVIGETWPRMAAKAGPSADSLARLLETGEALVVSGNGTAYLEARSSALPTDPPGRLLLVRDVSPAKAAEQTIRTLFQFLQDRDEDRTRLLQRTNAAIEAERNRIARDLHDGPIQGISGAAMSVQAIKLMMESGDAARAADLLHAVSNELADEALNLRRVMSDLRPPVLEERGLFPAVKELCEKSERDLGIAVTVEFGALSDVPRDLETLAYRVIQEALSNVSKHAEATKVTVRIEATGGTLAVEIVDNGRGFDPGQVRTFLRAGRVGLASMRERAELAGGTLTIRSGSGAGTTVTATLPYDILGSASAATA
jgi:PAS domain S-box-containing protein